MRKTRVIAGREYLAAVRTKTFVIGILIMPVMMGGSLLLQWLLGDLVDTQDKRFAVVDRAGRPELMQTLQAGIEAHNQSIHDKTTGEQRAAKWVVEVVEAGSSNEEQTGEQRFALSQRVRDGELIGFLELLKPQGDKPAAAVVVLRYHTNRPTYNDFSAMADSKLSEYLRKKQAGGAKLTDEEVQRLIKPVLVESRGLATRDAETGKVQEATDQGRFASLIVPMVLMLLMFMVVLMSSTPLMQGVVEEKMQKIAEVLLGSVRPFELMMGKLVGMAGVSLTISGVYLLGAYWAAHRFAFAEYVSLPLLLWFVLFQALAALMFGSLFIAIGAACTEMRETQNLLLPVMLLASLPMFLMGSVLREPNGPVVRGMSFFPFATPALMIARLATPPGLAWWEPVLGVALVLATTVFCVYAAGRIFRVGILLQGKGARLSEILKWVLKG